MLRNLILSYRALIEVQYKFTFNKTVAGQVQQHYIIIDFKEENFHHLVGLHKLKGVDKVKAIGTRGAQKIYDQILGNHITFSDLDKDTFKHKSAFMARATSLSLIPMMMDNIGVNLLGLYKFDKTKIGSSIDAKYLLHFRNRDKEFYFLFDRKNKRKNIEECYPVSVFRKKISAELASGQTPKHYEMKQESIKLLTVEKIQGGNSTVLYP